MKRLVPIALLGLLLYNTFGLAVAVLCFGKQFENIIVSPNTGISKVVAIAVPSLPYTDSWENEHGTPGLVQKNGEFYNVVHQRIERDTLFVTLQPNASARERFIELANTMNYHAGQDQNSDSAAGRAVKLLSELLKCYLPFPQKSELIPVIYCADLSISFAYRAAFTAAPVLAANFSPPDQA